jgi:hypothetical protein
MTGAVPARKWAADGLLSGIRRTFQDSGDVALAGRMGFFLLLIARRLDKMPLSELLKEMDENKGMTVRGVERIARLRQAWLASPFLSARNTCYVRAMTLYRFLDSGSKVKRIHFGVEPGVSATDRLHGHAWVTLDSELLEAPEPVLAGRVRELYAYPPHA